MLSFFQSVFIFGIVCAFDQDPCLPGNNIPLPNPDGRCPACGHGDECDMPTFLSDQWYRYDYRIVTECVQPGSCGTYQPIWMNGTFPSKEDGAIDSVGCLSTFDKCCSDSYRLRVKNCGSYHVYCLKDIVTSCPQRYCFDSPMPSTPSESVTTPLPPTEKDGSTSMISSSSLITHSTGKQTSLRSSTTPIRKTTPPFKADKDERLGCVPCGDGSQVIAIILTILVCCIIFTAFSVLMHYISRRKAIASAAPACMCTGATLDQPPKYKEKYPLHILNL